MMYSIHSELSKVFKPLDEFQFEGLLDSIRATGQQIPLKLCRIAESDNLYLLDGHNRLRACQQLGIEPFIDKVVTQFVNLADAVRAIVQINEHRRPQQLTKYEQLKLIDSYRKAGLMVKHGDNQYGLATVKSKTREEAAADIGASSRTVDRITKRLDRKDELVTDGISEDWLMTLDDKSHQRLVDDVDAIKNAKSIEELNTAVAQASGNSHLDAAEITKIANHRAIYLEIAVNNEVKSQAISFEKSQVARLAKIETALQRLRQVIDNTDPDVVEEVIDQMFQEYLTK